MFFLSKPSPKTIRTFLAAQKSSRFSYESIGATLTSTPPPGYSLDHHRVRLPLSGETAFTLYCVALKNGQGFKMPWLEIFPNFKNITSGPFLPGNNVAVLVHHLGFWSLNPCRVVSLVKSESESNGRILKFGFSYGTLLAHSESGEERFVIEYHLDDHSIWYDIYAFSRPRALLAKLGYPFTRYLQRRFAHHSMLAMKTLYK